jgi:hypothetical protein
MNRKSAWETWNLSGESIVHRCGLQLKSRSYMKPHETAADEPRPITDDALAEEAGAGTAPTYYYEAASRQFLVQNERGRWLPHDLRSVTRILKARGLSEKQKENGLSEIDLMILGIQNRFDVHSYGPLCGRHPGIVEDNGVRYLVTEDMNLPEVREGDWSTLRALFTGLFYTGETFEVGNVQFQSFLRWMKSSVEALRAGREQQQQALVICGPSDCGKSLVQNLITLMLGGRGAKAHRYFLGHTQFNADLFEAEHLIIEDNYSSKRISDRQRLGALLKEHCVGVTTASFHRKGRDAFNIRPWWRISITANDDPEAMMILPPLDDHIADKVMLLRASRSVFPMPVRSSEERDAFMGKLRSEIPAFLHFLLHEMGEAEDFADSRYNVKTFHHPDLAAALNELSPEADLLSFIDTVFAGDLAIKPSITLTAATIEKRLREANSRRTDKLLAFRNACGTYMGRLAVKYPARVVSKRTATDRSWTIFKHIG